MLFLFHSCPAANKISSHRERRVVPLLQLSSLLNHALFRDGIIVIHNTIAANCTLGEKSAYLRLPCLVIVLLQVKTETEQLQLNTCVNEDIILVLHTVQIKIHNSQYTSKAKTLWRS